MVVAAAISFDAEHAVQSVSQSLGELRAGHQSLVEFFDGLFDQVAAERAELEARQREFDAQLAQVRAEQQQQPVVVPQPDHAVELAVRSELAGAQSQVSDLLSKLEAGQQDLGLARNELVQMQAGLTLMRTQLDCQEEQTSLQSEQEQLLRAQLAEARSQRDTLDREVGDLHIRLAHLAGVTVDLANTQDELADVRTELNNLRGSSLESEQRVRHELQEQLAVADADRRGLTAELEVARQRVAELESRLSAEREQSGEKQNDWGAELRQLRSVLEMHAEMHAEILAQAATAAGRQHEAEQIAAAQSSTPVQATPVPQTSVPAATSNNASAPTPIVIPSTSSTAAKPGASDPVIGSVMAQFELLQRQRLNRHK